MEEFLVEILKGIKSICLVTWNITIELEKSNIVLFTMSNELFLCIAFYSL